MECFEGRYILHSLRGGPYDLELTLHTVFCINSLLWNKNYLEDRLNYSISI